MKRLIYFAMLVFGCNTSAIKAQQSDSLYLIQFNQQIDDYVVQKNVSELEKFYADDFVFSHGSGRVEGKAGWLKTVGRTVYPLRQHDSVKVELHAEVAVVKGNMYIRRKDKDKEAAYHLKYIRVYALRDEQWQLISHSTTAERHDN